MHRTSRMTQHDLFYQVNLLTHFLWQHLSCDDTTNWTLPQSISIVHQWAPAYTTTRTLASETHYSWMAPHSHLLLLYPRCLVFQVPKLPRHPWDVQIYHVSFTHRLTEDIFISPTCRWCPSTFGIRLSWEGDWNQCLNSEWFVKEQDVD